MYWLYSKIFPYSEEEKNVNKNFIPYSINGITEAYVDEHRVTLRFSEEPETLYKIAIDRKGVDLNKAKADIYASSSDFLKEYLVPVYKDSEYYERVSFSNLSNHERMNDISVFKSNQVSLNDLIENIEDPNISKCFTILKEYAENEIRNLKLKQKELKRNYENILKECTNFYQRIAIPEYKLSEDEKEEIFFNTIGELSAVTETPKEDFKKYYCVWSEKGRILYLLSYSFLKKLDYGLDL